jgi:hypothetical protein
MHASAQAHRIKVVLLLDYLALQDGICTRLPAKSSAMHHLRLGSISSGARPFQSPTSCTKRWLLCWGMPPPG